MKRSPLKTRFVHCCRTPVDWDTEDGLKAVITCYDTETRQWQDVESLQLWPMILLSKCLWSTQTLSDSLMLPQSYSLESEAQYEKSPTRFPMRSPKFWVLSIEGSGHLLLQRWRFHYWELEKQWWCDKQYEEEAYRYCAERKRWMLLPPCHNPLSSHLPRENPMPGTCMALRDILYS